jgi:hypothetical protein
MNRRHFLSSLATAVAGFTILPPATTYQRVWKVSKPKLWVIDWSVIPRTQPTIYDFLLSRRQRDVVKPAVDDKMLSYWNDKFAQPPSGIASCPIQTATPEELEAIFKRHD